MYIPLLLESLQIHKLPPHTLFAEVASILLQEPATCLRVLGFGDRVLDICFLETVEGDDYTVDFCERVVEVALLGGQLDFLCRRVSLVGITGELVKYFIQIDRRGERGVGHIAVWARGVCWLAHRFIHHGGVLVSGLRSMK